MYLLFLQEQTQPRSAGSIAFITSQSDLSAGQWAPSRLLRCPSYPKTWPYQPNNALGRRAVSSKDCCCHGPDCSFLETMWGFNTILPPTHSVEGTRDQLHGRSAFLQVNAVKAKIKLLITGISFSTGHRPSLFIFPALLEYPKCLWFRIYSSRFFINLPTPPLPKEDSFIQIYPNFFRSEVPPLRATSGYIFIVHSGSCISGKYTPLFLSGLFYLLQGVVRNQSKCK